MKSQRRCQEQLQAEYADALDQSVANLEAQLVYIPISSDRCAEIATQQRGRVLASGFETAEDAFKEQQRDGRLTVMVGICVERANAS